MINENQLLLTNNCLKDIVEWLKKKYIVCIYTKNISKYYYCQPVTEFVNNDQLLIYIDVSKDPTLLSEDEWPWYILNAGFFRYTSSYVLPPDKNTHHFIL